MNTPQSPSHIDPASTWAPDDATRFGSRLEETVAEQAHALQTGVDSLLAQAPAAITGAVNEADALLRSGLEGLRQATDRTSSYVRDEPIKAVLIAAAAGALGAVVLGWATRSRHGA